MNFAKYAAIHARHQPDKTCLIERTPSVNRRRTLTWKQFNDEINNVANYLAKELDVKKGDFVLHLQNNCLEWLTTYFAAIKLGAIIVPLNFRFIGSDVLYAASVCNPKVFIFGHDFLPIVQPIKDELKTVKEFICIGDEIPDDMLDYKKILTYDNSEALVDVEDQHYLTMMLTSGTTGKPKPVIHTHHSIQSAAVGNGLNYGARRNDNYVFFIPLYHSGSMFLWIPYYIQGATGTLVREFKEPKWIFEAVSEEKGTDITSVVPTALSMVNAIENGEVNLANYDLSNWRSFEIGGQPVPYDVMKRLAKAFPVGISNIYGITEGGGGGTFNLYPEYALEKAGSIGKPTLGVEAKVVDADSNEVGPGEVGELIFSTNRMMKEYYNNPEKTAATIKNGWLHTEDLVKTDEDGFFYIVDRMKDMITSGGENIYPVEIEAALIEHPKIFDVACIGYPDERLVEIVLAIVELNEGESMTEEEVIEYAKTKLAIYKVPRKVVFDPIIRNPTGKILKPQMREKYTGRKEAFKKLD